MECTGECTVLLLVWRKWGLEARVKAEVLIWYLVGLLHQKTLKTGTDSVDMSLNLLPFGSFFVFKELQVELPVLIKY